MAKAIKIVHPKNGKHKGMTKITKLPTSGKKLFPRLKKVTPKAGD